MKALEFQTRMNPDHTLTVPPEVVAHLQPDQAIRVLVLIPDSNDDEEWAQLAAEQFLQGYAPSDAVYDELPAG